MSEIFYITTWDKKPFVPKNTFVGTIDEILVLAAEHGDCNLKCLREETVAACAEAAACNFYETVEDKWHGTVIVAHSGVWSKYDQISRSQRIANNEWADVWEGDPHYCIYNAAEEKK